MPTPPSPRLGLLVVPSDPTLPTAAVEAVRASWHAAGIDERLVPGGHGRVWTDAGTSVRFVSTRQGGFRVGCPRDGRTVVAGFVRALSAWRAGGPRRLACVCGEVHDLADLAYAPPAAFATAWIVVEDVAAPALDPVAASLAKELWGEVRIVLRRG